MRGRRGSGSVGEWVFRVRWVKQDERFIERNGRMIRVYEKGGVGMGEVLPL